MIEMELDRSGKRIAVYFPYSREDVARIKAVPGRGFAKEPAPHWTIPATLEACRQMREAFGDRLVVGTRLRVWAHKVVERETRLSGLAAAHDAELEVLPTRPEYAALNAALRPYQRSGAAFMAQADANALNADQPGLGKTLEAIAAVGEARLDTGPMLVVSPKTALDAVWGKELRKWQPHPVYVAKGTKAQKQAIVDEFLAATGPRWLVVTSRMTAKHSVIERCERHVASTKPVARKCAKDEWGCKEAFEYEWPLNRVTWSVEIVDEAHKNAVRNLNTQARKGLVGLPMAEGGRRFALSGTPMTNKAIDLWGVLNWLDPVAWSSKWRFAESYLEIEDNGYGKKIGGLLKHKEQDLFRAILPYVLRRTKGEVLKELPPKQYVDIAVEMTTKQAKQYAEWEADAEWDTLSAVGVLDELTRLRQFATAYHVVQGEAVVPVLEEDEEGRGKYEALLGLLDERQIFDEDVPAAEAEKVVVFTQYRKIAEALVEALTAKGAAVATITGSVSQARREAAMEAFQQDGGPRVMVMTTQAGGVAITLDRASTVIFMDETWNPDDMEQAEDRVHRASRTDHQVIIYMLRSKGTVDYDVAETVLAKANVHKTILDKRRGIDV